ncbi:2-polyprenyl-6-methoxyphenol hydroxylase-like FAD-dependent oxidoreductase [Kineococcus radiotolerans]|uniref:2-polyprenyl-6-methoxyphenol hydroxylase-like FAD-dependent oxidoreductase n=1 Tax=Kineococcus radiotolerans TaxID=131568 RepID=A0A7W4XYZ8_KINRA|nr:FAD-dependent monooxygenase [Kineococcus radiotolerans]MBB2903558.1 2-polyprenyl-6-methoxyphenol hydroxylase-like FAD-dependent oxidoreductase [Kineococcus radiotolerans]
MARSAVVVGAGIGGLAAGVALARAGWRVSVHDRVPVLEPVGAGISLWPNALRALDVLGIGDAVRARSVLGAGSGIRRPDGRWLGRSDVAGALTARFGDPMVIVARSELTGLLQELLPPGSLHLGSRVEAVLPGDPAGSEPARAVFADGGQVEADLVVVADGIRSRSRSSLFPTHPGPQYAGYTTWRLLAPAPVEVHGTETWGLGGQRFAIVPMSGQRVYCYATATAPAGTVHEDEAAELRSRFGAWHDPIPQILRGLRPGDVLHHDVEELRAPLPSFTRGRVALLGDAAHAMTPELGQGGGARRWRTRSPWPPSPSGTIWPPPWSGTPGSGCRERLVSLPAPVPSGASRRPPVWSVRGCVTSPGG